MNTHSSQRGFIALISAVVISAILLILMTSVGASGFYARFDSLGSEAKVASRALADSCINVVLLALATSTDVLHYSVTNEMVTVGHDTRSSPLTCIISGITHAGSNATIDTYASAYGSFSSVSVTVSFSPTIQIISRSEK